MGAGGGGVGGRSAEGEGDDEGGEGDDDEPLAEPEPEPLLRCDTAHPTRYGSERCSGKGGVQVLRSENFEDF